MYWHGLVSVTEIMLRVQVDDYQYELTVDNMHEIFKRYGEVLKIAIFQKNNQWQALIQYPDHQVRLSLTHSIPAFAFLHCTSHMLHMACLMFPGTVTRYHSALERHTARGVSTISAAMACMH
jgi:hypothetical protein